ncbi:MAG: flagellar brake domain-containing protein [Selenomonas sp.]|jgi:c-di-GMP-binding flagellar brake protein YcgR|nr:flagellar brake domain-containing protein [Selenomonas sp.]
MAGELIKAKDILKIGQRVEFYVEESNERYTSRIEDITETELVVAMPMSRKRVPIIPKQDEKLYALAMGSQCRYRFFTVFHRAGHEEGKLPVWYISRPEQVERHQNRGFVRVRVNLPVNVRLIDEDGTIHDPIVTHLIDLSGSGACFSLDRVVKVGTKVGMELSGIPGTGAIEAMCQVARCSVIARDDGVRIYHVGVGFENLPRAITNKIVHYLFTVQRTSISRGINS